MRPATQTCCRSHTPQSSIPRELGLVETIKNKQAHTNNRQEQNLHSPNIDNGVDGRRTLGPQRYFRRLMAHAHHYAIHVICNDGTAFVHHHHHL